MNHIENKKCSACQMPCKQSSTVTVVYCPHYFAKVKRCVGSTHGKTARLAQVERNQESDIWVRKLINVA